MGLFGLLTGWDQDKAADNAVQANHLLPRLNEQQKKEIVTHIANKISIFYGGRKPNEKILRDLSNDCRVTQLNFVALACNDLGIEPPIQDGVGWRSIRNPYAVGGHTKERDISACVRWFAKRYGVSINWPGDDVKLDFRTWYSGQDDAEPKRRETTSPDQGGSPIPERGDDQLATITVPPETAAHGGSARVVLQSGRAFDVKVPAGVQDGAQLRLRGMGLPGHNVGEPGDAIVTVKISASDWAGQGLEVGQSQAETRRSTGGPDALSGYRDLPKTNREVARLFKLTAGREDAQSLFIRALFYQGGRCGLPNDQREASYRRFLVMA